MARPAGRLLETIKKPSGCFRFNWRRDTYWLPTLPFRDAGLIFADPHVMPYFRSHSGNLDDVDDVFDAPITSAEVYFCRLR